MATSIFYIYTHMSMRSMWFGVDGEQLLPIFGVDGEQLLPFLELMVSSFFHWWTLETAGLGNVVVDAAVRSTHDTYGTGIVGK
jgi:hypothetical protein